MYEPLKKVFWTAPWLVKTSVPARATMAMKPVRPSELTEAFLDRAAATRASAWRPSFQSSSDCLLRR